MIDKNLIRKHALNNAAKHDGKANPGSVIGGVIGEKPELKKKIGELKSQIMDIIKDVNSIKKEKQLKELKEKYPELLEEKKEEEKSIFAFLNIPEGTKIRTAFPPGPEKYPHLGHAKALYLNYELAKEYNGEFYLRFEDTNPTLVKKEFYEIMIENFKWLGIKWDKLMYASDYMQLFYDMAEKAIKSGDAYICNCTQEKISETRMKGTNCPCRNKSKEQNMKEWKEMFKDKNHILRLKIDMNHKNSTMRDPTIFRIIEEKHAKQGDKYRVWPTYDWQNAIMDGHFEITNRLRSKEFEMRSELQNYIQKLLGLHQTNTYEFARFNIKGVPSSGRIIREKIKSGELTGWDDPSLTTIVALRKRGFKPKAIKEFLLSTGITKSESTLEWGDLIVHNRRVLDSESERYFFIENPQEISIEGAPQQEITLNLHPENKKGGRHFSTHKDFYISEEDYVKLKDKKLYRLMDCLNFKKDEMKFVFDSLEYEKYKDKGDKIMHWLPVSEKLIDVEVIMPDKEIKTGLAESNLENIKVGDVIQFERFGFCRYHEKKDDKMIFYFTHK